MVEGKQQLEQYGSVIGTQARKLFEMVEQILLFAAIREGHQRYSLRPIEVTEILDAALSSTAGLVRTAEFHVERLLVLTCAHRKGRINGVARKRV